MSRNGFLLTPSLRLRFSHYHKPYNTGVNIIVLPTSPHRIESFVTHRWHHAQLPPTASDISPAAPSPSRSPSSRPPIRRTLAAPSRFHARLTNPRLTNAFLSRPQQPCQQSDDRRGDGRRHSHADARCDVWSQALLRCGAWRQKTLCCRRAPVPAITTIGWCHSHGSSDGNSSCRWVKGG